MALAASAAFTEAALPAPAGRGVLAAFAGASSSQAVNPVVPAVPPRGQVRDLPATICNQTVPEPARLPPASSPAVLTAVMLCFEKQGGSPVVEANTYLYYMQAKGSRPSLNEWIAFNDSVQQVALGDFKRLWRRTFSTTCRSNSTTSATRTASPARCSSTTWKSASA